MLSTYNIEEPIYLTEGETDMITLLQAGYQALGIPGANTFEERFVSYVNPYPLVIVVLDSDEAGDNLLKNVIKCMGEDAFKVLFVPMPRGVKDVNTFHCNNCRKNIDVFKEEFGKLQPVPATIRGFELLVETSEETGKDLNIVTSYNISNFIRHVIGNNQIEIDKFIKTLYDLQGKDQGIGKTTIKDVAKATVSQLLRESEVANEMLIAGTAGKLIEEEESCYTYKHVTPQGIVFEPFTSFTVKVIRREQLDSGEVQSVWHLENNDGRTQDILVGSMERASQIEFTKKVCMQDGFMYRCPPITGFHTIFMQYIEKDVQLPVISKCMTIGKYKDVWLFDEYGIDKKGDLQYLEDGKYTLDGVSFMPPVDSVPRDVYRARVNMVSPVKLTKEEVVALLTMLDENQGSKIAWIVLGWIAACFARDKVIRMGWGFPVCYITGNAQSGKTTLAKWLMKTAGFRNMSALGAKSSVFGINFMASVYSNLPLWFDDIRGLGEEGIWNTVILGAYENAGDLKGSKDRSLTQNMEYKSGMLITSEFFMKSPAAQSRCIQLVADENMQDRGLYSSINAEVDKVLPYLGVETILHLQKNEVKFEELLEKYREMLSRKGINSRFAQNFAVVLAGFKTMFINYIEETDEIWKEMVEYIIELSGLNDMEVSSNSYAQELVKDIGAILLDDNYNAQFKYGDDWIIREDKLYIKTSGLYDSWRRYKGVNNIGDYNSRREFVAQLRRLTYAVRNKAGTVSINGRLVTVIGFDLDKMRESKDAEISTLPALLEELDTSEFI